MGFCVTGVGARTRKPLRQDLRPVSKAPERSIRELDRIGVDLQVLTALPVASARRYACWSITGLKSMPVRQMSDG